MTGRHTAPEVVAANEASDKGGRRAFVDGLWVSELLDVTIKHDRNAIAHAHGFFLVVGDEDERDAKLTLQQLQLNLHFLAKLAIEGAEWLVEKQDTWSVH